MRILLPAFMAVMLLSACGTDEHQDLKRWMADAAKDMHGRVQPIPEIRPFPVVSYDAGDFLDPFSSAKVIPEKRANAGGILPDFNRPREPLEAYPLESLKMVGVVRKNKVLHALVQADRMIHQVRTGNHMGQNFGVVTSITESRLDVKELVQDPSGQTTDWVERLESLLLQESSQAQKEARK